jgi:acetyltransferase-like isoleucine patch superfamily enzyme
MALLRKLAPLMAMPVRFQFARRATVGSNVEIGWTARCANSNGRDTIKIGDNCSIWARLCCGQGGSITIGSYSTIRYKTFVGSATSIEIGRYCIISNNVTIYDHNSHPTDPDIRREMCERGFYHELWDWKFAEKAPVVIEDNVWIGQNALILKGVRIGEGSIVAAHAVVTREVPRYSIVAGNPARVTKNLR